MGNTDWKDALNHLKVANPSTNSEPTVAESPAAQPTVVSKQQSQPLVIRFEKRNGKPSTIISQFIGTTQALEQLASQLKKHCSAGGSAKDDEILIQGDLRDKVAAYLNKLGFSVKGDLKKNHQKR